ncbi:penicillin acylase family protein [Pueribacillus theae]|uniref:Penicillin acylase family protein n=1 Tax=Pueribacillus theae TaxID=2171751 RepID=A0A2U1K357_9BACI|nr:penicillin acylase family protein [Pueribacillus theae]PWA11946.1 penicillin acylase family protein [Pueribacillus theae]
MAELPVLQKKIKKRNWKKILFYGLAILIILCLGAFFFINNFINKSLPQIEGTIELPLLEDEVTVVTDGSGVPHIKAKNDHDLFVAQGYMQAQNRMFQMELSRRQASGTLSEVVGDATVEQDKYFRALGLRRAAEKSYDSYSDDAKQVLEWFAEGINAYIDEATNNNSLPVEFLLMGVTPQKWTPIDSLTIGKYMAFDLGGHWERQAFNYYALNHFSEEKAYELFPHYPKSRSTILQEDEVDIAANLAHAVIPHSFNGSNNWVVSGKKTKNGLPLLADDPHLGLATPSIWLQMHLETDEMNVSGVIFAGVPGIILGHNDKIAWGVTNTGPDVQQLYLEKRNPDNEQEFLFEDKWEKAAVIDEPIKVKDGETIEYQVVETRHGPVVSEFAKESGKDVVLSLRWTALDPTTELEAILDINRAENWAEFEKGLEKFLVPAQNFVFAAKDGTIAYKANGRIPIYENGDDALLPLPGWEAKYEWKDFIPYDKLPRVVNPEKGFIATANNKVAGENYPYHISNVWAQPYRYERIEEVLASRDDLTAEDMKAFQMDTMNLRAREFVPIFSDILSEAKLGDIEKQALAELEKWDFKDEANASQPLIFHHWFDEIEAILYDEIPDTMMKLFGSRGQTTDELLRKAASGEGSEWIDENGGLEQVLGQSLERTVVKLKEEYGEDVTAWKWGEYHKVQFTHPLSGINPILAYFFNHEKPMPVGGSDVTPMAASYNKETGEVDHGASWRFVIDLNNSDVGYHIVGPGQEGHFKSKWYHDQMDDWVEGTYHETKLSDVKGKKLLLTPAKK